MPPPSSDNTLSLALTASQEQAWIDVIHKMDETYADLLHYQVELESKNAALEEAQQFITSIEAAMTDVLIVCDFQGRIQRVNAALERIVGKTSAELLHQPFQTLFTQECLPLVNSFQQKIRATAIHDCEITLQGVHEAVPLAMNCTSRTDARGRIEGMVLMGRPVGELRKAFRALHQAHEELQYAQQQLVSAEKMAALGRLVAGVAHELNNPISFVYANMHAMQRYASRLREYLNNSAQRQIAHRTASLTPTITHRPHFARHGFARQRHSRRRGTGARYCARFAPFFLRTNRKTNPFRFATRSGNFGTLGNERQPSGCRNPLQPRFTR